MVVPNKKHNLEQSCWTKLLVLVLGSRMELKYFQLHQSGHFRNQKSAVCLPLASVIRKLDLLHYFPVLIMARKRLIIKFEFEANFQKKLKLVDKFVLTVSHWYTASIIVAIGRCLFVISTVSGVFLKKILRHLQSITIACFNAPLR